MAKAKERKSRPDHLWDVINAVSIMDQKRLSKEDFSKEHQRAVKFIYLANGAFFPGYINISKARTILQLLQNEEKGKSDTDREKARNKNK